MRKSRYLILNSLYFKFNDNFTEINEVKKLFDAQNILDILRFGKLSIINDYQFDTKNIGFIYFPNEIKEIYTFAFCSNKIQYINFSNCAKIQKLFSYSFSENNIKILDLSNCIYYNIFERNSFETNNLKILKFAKNNNIIFINENIFEDNQIMFLDLSTISSLTLLKNAFLNNPLKEIKILNDITIDYDMHYKDDIWNKFVKYYSETGKQAGDYKYENNQWKWYPLEKKYI